MLLKGDIMSNPIMTVLNRGREAIMRAPNSAIGGAVFIGMFIAGCALVAKSGNISPDDLINTVVTEMVDEDIPNVVNADPITVEVEAEVIDSE